MPLRIIAAMITLMLGMSRIQAQDVVISEYTNEITPDGEWTEIVVVKDDLNLVGWFVTDNNASQAARQGGVKFKDIPLWRHVREGTIIVIRHRGTTAYVGRDVDPSDGFLDLGLYDPTVFDVASFSAFAGSEMNIANEGDFLQVLRPDTSHVHGLGHRKPTGPYYDATGAPKANHDTMGVGNGRSVAVIGRSLAAYAAGIGKDSTSVSINVSQGLPNRVDNPRAFAGFRNRNHLLWREWREPEWSAPAPTLRVVTQTATAHVLEWTPLIDTYPDDKTTGVLVLRSTNGFADFDPSAIRDGAMLVAGQAVSTATLLAVHPNSNGNRYADSVGLECGKSYWYRVYGYRYGADNVMALAATADSTARGRQYNEAVWAQSPQVTKSLPSKPVLNASRLQVCPGDTVTISSSTVPGAVLYEWTLDGRLVPLVGTTRVIVREAGTYRLRVTADGGCTVESDPLTISVLPAQRITVSPAGDQTICNGDSVVITLTFDATQFEWYRNGTVIPGVTGKRYVATADGDYLVRSVTSQGCPGVSDVVRIRVRNATVRFEPATVDFGVLGACIPSAERTVDLVNTGSEPMTPTAADFPAGFTMVSPTPGSVTIPPGARIKVVMRFAPSSIGVASGQATVTSIPCSATASVTLRGERTAALASLDRARVDYGTLTSCPSTVIRADSTFLLRNQGTTPIRVRMPNVTPPFYLLSPQIVTDTAIAPNGTLAIVVQYRPLGADLDRGVLQDIGFPFSSASCNDTLRATLIAATYKPSLRMTPNTADIGNVYACGAGTSFDTLLTFSNDGRVPVTVASVSNATVVGLPAVIEPGASITRRARVTIPGQPGPFSVTGTVTAQPCSTPQTITITGTVVPLAVVTDRPAIDFGIVRLCEPSPVRSVTFRAFAGDSVTTALDVDDVMVSGPFSTSVIRGDQIVGSQDITVNFTPTATGVFTDTLRLTLQPCGVTVALPIRGEARTIGVSLMIVDKDFGTVDEGGDAQRSAMFTNSGTDTVVIDGVQGITPPFSLLSASPALPAVLAPGETLTLVLQYSFNVAGQTDTLAVSASVIGICPSTISGTMVGTSSLSGVITGAILSVPDNLEAQPGAEIAIPIILNSKNNLRPAGAMTLSVNLRYDPTIMRPISIISNIAGLSGTVVERRPGDAVVTLTSTTDPIVASAPLVTMRSAVYLGSAPFTTIALDSIVIPKVIATGDNGRLTVIGECRIEARQAGRGQGFAVSVERVDADGVYLDLTVLTHDPVTIRMVDALGCIRHVPLDGVLQPGRYRITVPANDMPSGLMLIDVIHAGLRRTVPVILVR